MKSRAIKETVAFKASPHDVYEALMDSSKHSEFTGSKAFISREAGGEFSVWGGAISGKNVELVPDKKIIQSWRSSESGWPEDHYSKATFVLEKIKGGTRLRFTQAGVPAGAYEAIKQGWYDYYWEPMKKFLEK